MQPARPEPFVYVVILAFNNVADTLECLGSIAEVDYENLRIVVVDNGSSDGTSDLIRERYPDVEVLRSPNNVGVPAGFNLGIVHALQVGCDYVLLLNNDTVVAPDLVRELVTVAQSDPTLGVLMPKILYYNHPAVLWSLGARYRRFPPAIVFVGLGQPDNRSEAMRVIEYAPSCGLLIPRDTFVRVGLLDSSYRFYYDDWDFSNRVRAAGFRIGLVPKARMWHKVSRTIKGHSDVFWRTWGESATLYFRRYGRPAWLSLVVHLGYIVLRELAKGNGPALRFFFQGIWQGFRKSLEPNARIPENIIPR